MIVAEIPLPDEEVFTSPSYLFIEIVSPEDTMTAMQDRIDDYIQFGAPNIWLSTQRNIADGAQHLKAGQSLRTELCVPPMAKSPCRWLTYYFPEH